MPEMNVNRSHVVSALTAMHAEMAGEIQHYEQEIRRISIDQSHVAATLKLLAPTMDLRTIRTKRRQERNVLFRPGEIPRSILDVLRQAGMPLTSREMVERILADRNIEATAERVDSVQKSLLNAIKGLEARKLIRVVATSKGGTRSWVIA